MGNSSFLPIHIKSEQLSDMPPSEIKSTSCVRSYNYDENENRLWHQEHQNINSSDRQKTSFQRWFLTFLVAVCTAIIAIVIDLSTNRILSYKFAVLHRWLDQRKSPIFIFCIYVAVNIFFVVFACLGVVYIEPVAKGSGIGEIKCVLNGIKLPRVVRIKTLFVKTLGIIFSVSAGMPCGKEGPMIHAGAIIASGVSQGKSTTMGFDTSWTKFKAFRNHKEKRNFISCGAAAGVSAAFGAPIGGVLFSLEEGSSFWNQKLTWRTFFCSMTASFIVGLILTIDKENVTLGQLGDTGMFTFGIFPRTRQHGTEGSYNVYEIPIFMLIGVGGGIIGWAYNEVNKKITIFRQQEIETPRLKILEVVAVSMMVSFTSFGIPYLFRNDCYPIIQPIEPELKIDNKTFVQFYCPPGHYNMMASMFFSPSDLAIKLLFHETVQSFKIGILLIYFFIYTSLACWTYGLNIPSGLFVPTLLAGAAYGRIIGEMCNGFQPIKPYVTNAGTYALIGAAALLGGVARMTISLTVILIEATGNIQYGLPLMLTLISAKWVGDHLHDKGIYDIHIEIQSIPFLEWDSDPRTSFLQVHDVMSKNLKSFKEIEKVGRVYHLLKSCSHNSFPVITQQKDIAWQNLLSLGSRKSSYFGPILVDEKENYLDSRRSSSMTFAPTVEEIDRIENDQKHGWYMGTITRECLCMLIKKRAFFDTYPKPYITPAQITWEEMYSNFPRFPKIENLNLAPTDYDMYIDLTPYMNPTSYTIYNHAPLSRAFRLFRTMGLQNLPVVNHLNIVVGILTRNDLVTHHRELASKQKTTWYSNVSYSSVYHQSISIDGDSIDG